MNELLQKHGCSNVFTIPEGLRELMADITREVLRTQPINICDFISNYLSALLITREHGILSAKILEDLCDCRPTVSEHLLQLGVERETAEKLAQVIKDTIEEMIFEKGTDKVYETDVIKNILMISKLDADMTIKICQVARNAYREYWYKKQTMEKHLKTGSEEPWEIAAQHTIEIYKKTKPSFNELIRATIKIQSAYKGYHYRRHLLDNLKPKHHHGPKKVLPGPPLDVAESREIDLGPVMKLDVKKKDEVDAMLSRNAENKLSLKYDPNKTITHVDDDDEEYLEKNESSKITAKSTKPPIVKEAPLHQPFHRESQDFKFYQGPKSERLSDTLQPSKLFKSESTFSQFGDGTRKKAISIFDKPKEFLIEARETKQAVFVAPKAPEVKRIDVADTVTEIEEAPMTEVPEDINDDVSSPTASVPTEAVADDTDVEVEDATDDGEDNQIDIHDYE